MLSLNFIFKTDAETFKYIRQCDMKTVVKCYLKYTKQNVYSISLLVGTNPITIFTLNY